MNRRDFLASLAATALTGACRALPSPQSIEKSNNRLIEQSSLGHFDSAICGTHLAPLASIGDATPTSLVEVASVSKTFLHLIAARLYAQGRLDIDAPFTTYLPDHALARSGTDITIRDLAVHGSGFTNGWMGRAGIYSAHWPYASDADWERAVLAQRPVHGRREKYVYACHNSILLGFIIERLLGLDLDAAARKYVWAPLAMRDTTWKNCVGDPRVLQIYTNGPCPRGLKGDENARHVTKPIGNAGVFTTYRDLQKYADDLLARRTFEPEAYKLIFTPDFEIGRKRRSFGWDMSAGTNPPGWSAATINHSGYTGQYLAIDPTAQRAAIVLTNLRLKDAKGRAAAYEARRELAASMWES